MAKKILENTLKTNNTDTVTIQDLRDIQHDIKKGRESLIEEFGSQEKVDAHLREIDKKLYQKLFSTPVTCSKRNCSYLS